MVFRLRIPSHLSRYSRFFCVVDLSSFYYRRIEGPPLHQGCQQQIATAPHKPSSGKSPARLIRLMTPILVFTAEELWKFLPKAAGEPESVHIALFPEEAELRTGLSADKTSVWELLGKVRGEVLKRSKSLATRRS